MSRLWVALFCHEPHSYFQFFFKIFLSLILTISLSNSLFAYPPSADPLPTLGPYSCYADIPAPDINVVTGETTDCGGPVTVTFLSDSPDPGCSGTVIRTYRLTDTCDITTDITQNILIHDLTPPTASPLPNLGPYSCYSQIPAPNINLVIGETDNCSGIVTVSFGGDSANPGCSGTVVRSYILTDECGNTSSLTQNITINDNTPPVITSCAPDITVNCPGDVPAPNPSLVSFTSSCGGGTVTHVSDIDLHDFMFDGESCAKVIVRTYRVTDACGNAVVCTQNIRIADVCDPNYECPLCEPEVPHFVVDFTNEVDLNWSSPPVEREGLCCTETGPPPPRCIHFTVTLPPDIVAITFDIESGAVPSGSLFYQIDCAAMQQVGETICLPGGATYEITFCKPGSNENVYSINVHTGDILPDTIDAQVNCGQQIIVEGILPGSAEWNDLTGGGIYNSYLSCTSGCLNPLFTPDDNAPPVILYEVCGDRGSVICGEPYFICDTVFAIVHPDIIATVTPNPAIYCADNIGTLTGNISPAGTYNTQWYNGPNGTGNVVGTGLTFTPTTTGTYSFVAVDTQNNFGCGGDTVNVPVTIIPLPQFSLGNDTAVCTSATVFFDLPDGPVYTWSPMTGVMPGADPGQFTITGNTTTTYTVTAETPEGCAYTDTWSLIVMACSITCPTQTHCSASDIIIYQTVPEFIAAGGTIMMPCINFPDDISLVNTISDGMSCPETITQTYAIEDACGNIETCDVVITLNDLIPPTWTSSPNPVEPINCTAVIPPHETLTADDNCSVIINTSIDPYTEDLCNGYEVTLRWTLMDSCGNSAPDQTLTIEILPMTPPAFINTPPSSMTIACDDAANLVIPSLSYNNGQSGNCAINGNVPGTLNGPVNECGGQFTIEWEYTDACDRTVAFTQTVTVTDDGAPVITCPANMTLVCAGDIPPAPTTFQEFVNAGGNASDNCGLMTSSFTVDETDTGICPRTITRTYTILDSCGNSGQCVQTFSIDDPESPVLTCPANLSLECEGDIPGAFNSFAEFIAGGGSASDNCGLVESSFTLNETTAGTCPLTITRIYTIEDSCGNQGQCAQIILIDDQQNPVITCPPDQNHECSGDLQPAITNLQEFLSAGGSVSDNCGIDPASFTINESESGTCPKTLLRTYSIADNCGNVSQCIQSIVINDNETPLINCPGNITIKCAGEIPPIATSYSSFIASGGSVSDNCEIDINTFTADESNNGTCPLIITRTYAIADSCGNIGQCVQTITVQEQEPPVIQCPSDINSVCISEIPPAFTSYADFIAVGGMASDNCGLNEASFAVNESDQGTCPRVITRTYSIADSCGNMNECTQTITVDDPQPPQIICPANGNYDCVQDVPPAYTNWNDFITGGGSASDNCGIVESSFSFTETDQGTCPHTITRTYVIADSCGNIGQCTQTIIIHDQIAPNIVCPGSLNFECSGEIPPIPNTYNEFIVAGGNAADNCALNVASFTAAETDQGICPRTITRTFTIADSCGNTGQCVQTIIVDDSIDPVITCPADEVFECTGELPPMPQTYADFQSAGGSASDNCQLDETTFTANESVSGVCPRLITRTYTIADECGNIGMCTQTISIDDQVDPVITCPGDIMLECLGDVPPLLSTYNDFINGGGSVSDNCVLDELSFNAEENESGTCPKVVTRIYTIADSCGNVSQCTQTISVGDQLPPVVICPGDLSLECSGDVPSVLNTYNEFIAGGGSISDNCEVDESTFTVTESDNGTCPRTITRTYFIADACGNIGQCTQTIMVGEQEPPVIICPEDNQSECLLEDPGVFTTIEDFINGGGSISDNCAIDESTFSVTQSESGTCPKTIIRIYTIADSCGNTGQCVQTLTIHDQTPPEITCPSEETLECSGDIPAPYTSYLEFIAGGGVVSDNCAIDEGSFTFSETDEGVCPRIITRTYTIADSCGNTGQCEQTITKADQSPPEIICPQELNFECVGNIPPLPTTLEEFMAAGGSVSDNCALNESSFTVNETDEGICPRTVTRTFTVADSCGNTNQCVQVIIIDDTVPPVINCPGDETLECTGNIPPAYTSLADFIEGGGSVDDNCELDETTFSLKENITGTCPKVITRIYSIADLCGNKGECTQTITINDQTPPEINCPGDLQLDCAGDIPLAPTSLEEFIAAGGSVSDNCVLDESSFTINESDNGTCPRQITRIFSIADSCGNISMCTQIITVDDQVGPVINCPGDLTLTCEGEIPPAISSYHEFIANGGTASDNCELDTSTFTIIETDEGTCPRTITITYSIADSCGNTGHCIQTIVVNDTEPPTASNPASIQIICNGEIPPPDPDIISDASDNCGTPIVEFVSDENDGNTCPETITRTYSVKDECENEILLTQTITIGDDEPPVAIPPPPISVECLDEAPAPDPTMIEASDNCSEPVVEFVSDESDGGTCPETITRTYSITDECDNQILLTQTITIGDDQPPVFVNPPSNITINCAAEIPEIPELEYTDNCIAGGTVEGTVTGPSGDPPVVTWTWSITDECDNKTSVTVTITITETENETQLTDIFCTGDEYVLPDGSITTTGGTFGPYTFTSSSGCDSIVTLELTGIDPVEIFITEEKCEGEIFILPDGNTTEVGGTFGPYNFTASTGCDSIVMVEVSVIESITTELTADICTGDDYILPDGTIITEGGVYGPYIFISQAGCDSIVNVTVNEAELPIVAIEDVGPLCISSDIITLIAIPPGGTWSGDVSSDQFDPGTEGTGDHQIIYTYTNGSCSGADTITISVYELQISCETISNESFPGANDGSARVTVSGGIPPYTITWTGSLSGTGILNQDSAFIIESLTAGMYIIEVTDATGCTATCEFTITADVPCELSFEVEKVDVTCPGSADGSVTINAAGTAPPFQYSLDGIQYQSDNIFNGLPAGIYTVFAQDALGCIVSQSITIESGPGPELEVIEIVNASCGTNNGSIEVIASGGNIPYTYSIDGINYGLSGLFPGLGAGTYTIYLQDGSGCTDTVTAIVGSSAAPIINNIIVTNASCGQSDGTITILASGGLGALSYSINGGDTYQSSNIFQGLASGTYSIAVKDEADCLVTGTATIQEDGAPEISDIVIINTTCDQSDGSITITATGIPVLRYSINGSNFQMSNTFQNLPSGTYTVYVRDGNGCVAVEEITINSIDGPQIQNLAVTHTTCGNDNGTLLITATGGTGELEFIVNGENHGDEIFFEDLPSGTYHVEVIDENGCIASGEINILPSVGPDFDTYITPAHCGLADGILEMDGIGGTPPYTYSINGGPFTANFTFVNRVSEYYLLAVKDANGCIFEEEVFLWEEEGPSIEDILITQPECGSTEGRLEIIADGDALQYSIATPPVFQDSPVFESVNPGTYTILIRDEHNCRDQSTAVIEIKPLPVIDATVINSECGMSIGSISVMASVGVAPYEYKLDQGNYSSTSDYNNLPAGNYLITVRDANGCEVSEIVTVEAEGSQTGTASASICEGKSYTFHNNTYTEAGTYSITLQGGAGNGCDSVITLTLSVLPYQIVHINASTCPGIPYDIDGHIFTESGEYLIDTLSSLTDCDTIRMLTLMINEINERTVNASICEGDSYEINGQTYTTTGFFIVDTLQGQNGCDTILNLALEVHPVPTSNAGEDQMLTCNMNSVTLNGSASGGSFQWTGPGITPGNATDASPLVSQPGTYYLSVTSGENCFAIDSVLVETDPSAVMADAGPNAFLSCDVDSVTLFGGPVGSNLVYQWTGPGITAYNEHEINPVVTIAGIYSLVVTDTILQCVSPADTVTIVDITNEIIAIIQDPNSLDCFSTFIDLNATGSSNGANVVYIWFNENGDIVGNSPLLEVTSGGQFTFVVRDTISGCFDQDTVSVTDLIAYPPVDAGQPQVLDCYQLTVVLNEGAQNNLPNLVFQWNGPVGGIIGPDTLLSATVGLPGIYSLTALDTVTGCANTDSVLVMDGTIDLIAEIQMTEAITCNDNTALLNIGASSIGTEISYSWNGPGYSDEQTTYIEPDQAGTFTLTVMDGHSGCSAHDTIVIDLPLQILDLEALVEIPLCAGSASGSIAITDVTGGLPPNQYSLDNENFQSEILFDNLIAGQYTIYITDANGCTYEESIFMEEGEVLTLDIGIDIQLELGDSIQLDATINIPWMDVDSLVWTPDDILSCTHCQQPTLYGLLDDIVTATVYANGCLAEDMITLRVDQDVEIYIPNVFSPNGDGINDHVTVFTDHRVRKVVLLQIFDRWGNMVFQARDFPPNDPGYGWDGRFKERSMNPAVFAYIATVELLNGTFTSRKGDITLVR